MAFENFSVGGNGFSWEDDEVVPRLNFGAGDNFFGALCDESSGWGCKSEEIFQRLGEFRFGALFDPLTCENEGGDGGRSIWSNCIVGCLNRGDPAPAVFNAKEVEVSSVAGRMGLRAVVCLRATRSRVLSRHTSENVTCQR